jgi:hypothetical protein
MGRQALEQRLNQPPLWPPQQMMPVEQVINKTPLSSEERAWLRQHPELIRDPVGNKRLEVAYLDAWARGSPEYFDFFDNRLGYKNSSKVTLTAGGAELCAVAGARRGRVCAAEKKMLDLKRQGHYGDR